MNKRLVFIILIAFGYLNFFSQTKVSNASGSWTTPTIWTPNGVPTNTDNVLISNGNVILINANIACNNLTIGLGGAASQLQFNGNTARVVSVTNDVVLSSTGTFSILSNSNATHSLNIGGNLLNNGTFRMFEDNNSLCNVTFNKNGNQTVSGSGPLTRFNRIIVNMGTSNNNVLDITSTSFTTITNFLTLSNGTFKFSSPNATIVPFTAATTVQVNSGLWLNSTTSLMSFSAGVGLVGLMRVSDGIMNIGNANNEDLTPNGGTLTINNGTLNISGKYSATATATTFSMTGGQMNISNNASTNTSIAPFHISAVGTSFNMSGGTIVLRREGGSGAQDLGYLNTGSTSGIISGGTLQCGSPTSPANQTININSTFTVPNLVVASASVTAKILTNPLTVLGNISINTGTLLANNLGITLGGNWANTSTFVPGTGTVTFNSNLAQTISRTGGETFNSVLFSGTGLKTFGSAITVNSNFSISTSSSVDVSNSNFQLTVGGNFINNGGFNSNQGLVFFNGSVAQSLGGTSITDFYNLTLNNPAGLSLSSGQRLINTLTLNNGTFNTSNTFTMLSTSSNTSRIAQITGTGDIIGNVTLQRFAPGGSTGWSLLGAPISSPLTFNDWDDNIFIACPSCPDGSVPSFTSIYSYDETAAGSFSSSNSYIPINSINNTINPNLGYWVYLGNGQFSTTGITIDVVGTVRKNSFSLPLNYSNTGSPSDDGWNLICNPYPSPISWALLRGVTPNIDNAIYVYNADLNAGTGANATYINGISSPLTSAGGIGDAIPLGQGFYVHSTGATALSVTESIKIASSQALLKTTSTAATKPILRLAMDGPYNFNDETVLYFEQGASSGFDQQFDAVKFVRQNMNTPIIALTNGLNKFQVNGISPVVGTFSQQIIATTGYTGTYTIQITDDASFPKGACINLYDKFLNTTTNLRQNSYVFNLHDTTTVARFVLWITSNPLSITSSVNYPNCSQPQAAKVVAKGNGVGPWNYYWSLNNQNFKSTLNLNGADSIFQLQAGQYELQVNTAGSCNNHTSNYLMQDFVAPISLFTCVDTLYLNQSDSVVFNNLSTNSIYESWDFGDNTYSNDVNPVKRFLIPGDYSITLQGLSHTNCQSSYTKVLRVETEPLSNHKLKITNNRYLIKTLENNRFELSTVNDENNYIHVKLFNMQGLMIKDYGQLPNKSLNLKIDLHAYAQGLYNLIITGEDEQKNIKLIVR